MLRAPTKEEQIEQALTDYRERVDRHKTTSEKPADLAVVLMRKLEAVAELRSAARILGFPFPKAVEDARENWSKELNGFLVRLDPAYTNSR